MNQRFGRNVKIIINSFSLISINININKPVEFLSNLHYKDSPKIHNKYVGCRFDFMKIDPLQLN